MSTATLSLPDIQTMHCTSLVPLMKAATLGSKAWHASSDAFSWSVKLRSRSSSRSDAPDPAAVGAEEGRGQREQERE